MEQLISERLQDNLSRLKLNRTAEVLDTVVQQAMENKSHIFLFWIIFLKKRWRPKINAAFIQP